MKQNAKILFAAAVLVVCCSVSNLYAWGISGGASVNNVIPAGGQSSAKPSGGGSLSGKKQGLSFSMGSALFKVSNSGGWNVVDTTNRTHIFNIGQDNNHFASTNNWFDLQSPSGEKMGFLLNFVNSPNTFTQFYAYGKEADQHHDLLGFNKEALNAQFTLRADSAIENPSFLYEKGNIRTAVGFGGDGYINKLSISGEKADGSAYKHEIGINRQDTESRSGVQVQFGNQAQFWFWNSDYSAGHRFGLTLGTEQLTLTDKSDNSERAIPYQDAEHGVLQSVNFKKDETFDLTYRNVENNELKTVGLAEFKADADVLTSDQLVDGLVNGDPGCTDKIAGLKNKPEQASEMVTRLSSRLDPEVSTLEQLGNTADAIGLFFTNIDWSDSDRAEAAKTVEQPLLALLTNPNSKVQERAAYGLMHSAEIGNQAVTDAFETMLSSDKSEGAKYMAAFGLEIIGAAEKDGTLKDTLLASLRNPGESIMVKSKVLDAFAHSVPGGEVYGKMVSSKDVQLYGGEVLSDSVSSDTVNTIVVKGATLLPVFLKEDWTNGGSSVKAGTMFLVDPEYLITSNKVIGVDFKSAIVKVELGQGNKETYYAYIQDPTGSLSNKMTLKTIDSLKGVGAVEMDPAKNSILLDSLKNPEKSIMDKNEAIDVLARSVPGGEVSGKMIFSKDVQLYGGEVLGDSVSFDTVNTIVVKGATFLPVFLKEDWTNGGSSVKAGTMFFIEPKELITSDKVIGVGFKSTIAKVELVQGDNNVYYAYIQDATSLGSLSNKKTLKTIDEVLSSKVGN